MKIGIPQALLYYKYFPQWQAFFEELGQEVVVSTPTNKSILKNGTALAENEVCVPVKIFYGHVVDLKSKVDALFIPRVVSVEGDAFTCPKFLGLPDIIKAVDGLPPIIEPTFDSKLGFRKYYQAFEELGQLFANSRLEIFKAFVKSKQALAKYELALQEGFSPLELLADAPRATTEQKKLEANKGSFRIGVAGHPYNIYDPFISMNLIKRLNKKGAFTLTTETVPKKVVKEELSSLPKELFWTYERDVLGSVFHWLREGLVDGIIYMLSFACGPDSLIQVLIDHEAKKGSKIPVMPVVIDEHTAEAGLVTRLEAFVDMILRKKEHFHEGNLASYGNS